MNNAFEGFFATAAVGAVVFVFLGAIAFSVVRSKKRNKASGSCSCACSGCCSGCASQSLQQRMNTYSTDVHAE